MKAKTPKKPKSKQIAGDYYLSTSFENAIQVLAGNKKPKSNTVRKTKD